MLVFCENINYICKKYAKRMAQIKVGHSVFYSLCTYCLCVVAQWLEHRPWNLRVVSWILTGSPH